MERERGIFTESYEVRDFSNPRNYDIGLPDFPRYEAFGKGARKEIGERDNWTCQGIDLMGGKCYWELMLGKPAKFNEGFMITGAHYPELHQKTTDHDISHGRCLCILCHASEELTRNNEWGAKMLLKQNSILTWNREDETGERWEVQFEELRGLYDDLVKGESPYQIGSHIMEKERVPITVYDAKKALGTRRGNRL